MTEHSTQTAARPEAAQPSAPLAVRNAAWAMYAGAAASVARGVTYLATQGATKAALERRFPHQSAAHITTLTHATVIAGSVASLVGAVLFFWIARESLQGKNWARITAAVLCGIGIVGAFIALTVPAPRTGRSSADLILSFVVAGIGLVSICILWQRNSNAYFRQFTRPRA